VLETHHHHRHSQKDNKRHTVKDTFLLCKYVESLLYHHHQIKMGAQSNRF
jgi:hypothetical protein